MGFRSGAAFPKKSNPAKGKVHDIIAALLLLARLAGEGSLRAVLVFYWLSPLSLYVTY